MACLKLGGRDISTGISDLTAVENLARMVPFFFFTLEIYIRSASLRYGGDTNVEAIIMPHNQI